MEEDREGRKLVMEDKKGSRLRWGQQVFDEGGRQIDRKKEVFVHRKHRSLEDS